MAELYVRRLISPKTNLFIFAYAFALSIASGFVVMKGAGDGPYHIFRHSDAFVQIGAGIALIVLWFHFGAGLIYAAINHRISPGWLALIIWIVIVLFHLWQSPTGYVADITKFVVERQ